MSAGKIVLLVVGIVVALCAVGGIIVAVTATKAVNKATQDLSKTTAPAPAATTDGGQKPGNGPATFALGQAAKLTGSDGAAGTVTVSSPTTKTSSLDSKTYVQVTVDIQSTAGTIDYNPFYFKLKDSSGVEHDAGAFADSSDALQSGNLPAGQKVHGTIAFDAPASALHGSQVELSDPLFQTIGYWTLP